MKFRKNKIKTIDGYDAEHFTVKTAKGDTEGLFIPEVNKILVHSIISHHGLKEIMNRLVREFKTNKIEFSPLITDGLKNKVRGKIKTIPKSDPSNPYGEDIEVLETIWKVE